MYMYVVTMSIYGYEYTVDREIFAFKCFRVINVRVSNFHHKVQEVKIIHRVFYFRVADHDRGENFLAVNISRSTVCTTMYMYMCTCLNTDHSPYNVYMYILLNIAFWDGFVIDIAASAYGRNYIATCSEGQSLVQVVSDTLSLLPLCVQR